MLPKKTKNAPLDLITGVQSRALAGTKADRFFTRSGMSSIMDTGKDGIVATRSDEINRGIGKGTYSLKMVTETGGDLKDDTACINVGGRIHYPNSSGVFTFIDRQALEYEAALAAEVESYVDQIAYLACASDQNFAKVLNCDMPNLVKLCAPKGANDPAGANLGIYPELDEYSCLPSLLSLLPKEGIEFARGMAKLRAIIKATMPIMDDNTHTKAAVNEETH